MKKLSLQKSKVGDWREMVESVMIDFNYDGAVFTPTVVDVPIPTETFILHGVIDLLRGEGDTVEIVDFKTDRKPDMTNAEDALRVENYHRQLEVYSHIVEEKFGKRVSKMHLYYTRVENETPYVSWDFDKERVVGTLRAFSRTVAKIESHQFSNEKVRKCSRLCDGCDMRFYCHYK